jgi:hypothetical protein
MLPCRRIRRCLVKSCARCAGGVPVCALRTLGPGARPVPVRTAASVDHRTQTHITDPTTPRTDACMADRSCTPQAQTAHHRPSHTTDRRVHGGPKLHTKDPGHKPRTQAHNGLWLRGERNPHTTGPGFTPQTQPHHGPTLACRTEAAHEGRRLHTALKARAISAWGKAPGPPPPGTRWLKACVKRILHPGEKDRVLFGGPPPPRLAW